jgi:hypothetical protein
MDERTYCMGLLADIRAERAQAVVGRQQTRCRVAAQLRIIASSLERLPLAEAEVRERLSFVDGSRYPSCR